MSEDKIKTIVTALMNLCFAQGFMEAKHCDTSEIRKKIEMKHQQLINLLCGDEEQ